MHGDVSDTWKTHYVAVRPLLLPVVLVLRIKTSKTAVQRNIKAYSNIVVNACDYFKLCIFSLHCCIDHSNGIISYADILK